LAIFKLKSELSAIQLKAIRHDIPDVGQRAMGGMAGGVRHSLNRSANRSFPGGTALPSGRFATSQQWIG